MKNQQHTNPVPEGKFIYYVKQDKQIVGTVAFEPNDDGTVNRGIAVTGLGESGGRRIGRSIALNRLEIATKDKESSRAMNFKRDACARFAQHFEGVQVVLHKCGFGVKATPFERRIIESTSSE